MACARASAIPNPPHPLPHPYPTPYPTRTPPSTPTQVLWDLQYASIRAGAERQLFTGEVGAHPTVRRYAALTTSVLRLMAQLDDDEGAGPAGSRS
jgi:hypothetical protein